MSPSSRAKPRASEEHRALGHHRRAHHRPHVHSRNQFGHGLRTISRPRPDRARAAGIARGRQGFRRRRTSIAALAILMLAGRSIALVSIYFTGNTRLPMVAGWDRILPLWFSRLQPRYKTPINSIFFVGIVTLSSPLRAWSAWVRRKPFRSSTMPPGSSMGSLIWSCSPSRSAGSRVDVTRPALAPGRLGHRLLRHRSLYRAHDRPDRAGGEPQVSRQNYHRHVAANLVGGLIFSLVKAAAALQALGTDVHLPLLQRDDELRLKQRRRADRAQDIHFILRESTLGAK